MRNISGSEKEQGRLHAAVYKVSRQIREVAGWEIMGK